MKEQIDTCIAGNGVVCGLEVHVSADCSIEVSEGTLVLGDGTILHTPLKRFRRYVKSDQVDAGVKSFLLSYLKISDVNPQHMEFLQLAGDDAGIDSTDSLKQQHPDDIPERNLNRDKIMVVLAMPAGQGTTGTPASGTPGTGSTTPGNPTTPGVAINVPAATTSTDSDDEPTLFWVLITRNALANANNIAAPKDEDDQSLFSSAITTTDIDVAVVDQALRPVLQLPLLTVPRVGYKKLALMDPAKGLQESNLQMPFTNVNTFSQLFFEYKAIIDDYILVFRDALKTLHDLFGPLLTHKGADALDQYRKILLLKLKTFYEEGQYLLYIQYVYDWLRDLTIAYNELTILLNGYRGVCTCKEVEAGSGTTGTPSPTAVGATAASPLMVMLGPVLGGRTTYSPLIFRDLALSAERDARIREVRCAHWRMMVMIRTFDLPFLHLETVTASTTQGIEETLDSTDYWESIHSDGATIFDGLPVKFTPTRSSAGPLGKMAIPYYYPLDSNSVYSVHQFWDYETTVLRRIDTLLSYNAHPGDDNKAVTDAANDSYTSRPEVLQPLVYNLEPYHWLRPEGHIGRRINIYNSYFRISGFDLGAYLQKYNLCVDVIAIPLPGDNAATNGIPSGLQYLMGMEHRPVLHQGQTLVLLYTGTDEQIELAECKKTERPEVSAGTVVADFVLPYRFSCCQNTRFTNVTSIEYPFDQAT
jgi:hypothetical protein